MLVKSVLQAPVTCTESVRCVHSPLPCPLLSDSRQDWNSAAAHVTREGLRTDQAAPQTRAHCRLLWPCWPSSHDSLRSLRPPVSHWECSCVWGPDVSSCGVVSCATMCGAVCLTCLVKHNRQTSPPGTLAGPTTPPSPLPCSLLLPLCQGERAAASPRHSTARLSLRRCRFHCPR